VTGVVSQNSTNPELSISKLLPSNPGGGGACSSPSLNDIYNFSLSSKVIKILALLILFSTSATASNNILLNVAHGLT
jgi:hypothetical protein